MSISSTVMRETVGGGAVATNRQPRVSCVDCRELRTVRTRARTRGVMVRCGRSWLLSRVLSCTVHRLMTYDL